MAERHIKITPQQRQFLQAKTRGVIFRGGIGSGKTRILCYKTILNALNGRRECIVSFSYPSLRDVVLHTMRESLEVFGLRPVVDYEINKTEMVVRIHGTEILLRSGDNPDSLRGLNIHDFLIDEARQFKTRDIFDIMLGRIRNSEDAQWYIATTPRGRDWVWKLGEQEAVTVILQRTTQNPFLPLSYIEELKAQYTTRFAAQELDADIVDFAGEIINSAWFKVAPYIKPKEGVRFWDVAVSVKKSADFSAAALCLFSGACFAVADMAKGRWAYPDLRKLIIKKAIADGTGVMIGLEDAGQQRAFIDDLRQEKALRPYTIKALRPRGDKLNRALPWVSQAEMGNVKIFEGAWNDDFKEECDAFTADDTHPHDDQIDAVSGAYSVLTHKSTATFANLYV